MTAGPRPSFAHLGGLLRSVSIAAVALGSLSPSTALSATYLVANEADLRAAIIAANASPDASSTIVMTGSFGVLGTGTLPTPTKSLTIDTQGFTLSGTPVAPNNQGTVRVDGSSPSGTLTIAGTLVGGAQGGAIGAGAGLFIDPGAGSSAQLINNGSITGGTSATGRGGLGVSLGDVITFINNGTVSGGAGVGVSPSNNGAGVNQFNGGTVINNGTILGGNGQTNGGAGAGVFIRSLPAANASLTNFGTIRGGSVVTGTGNAGILARGSLTTIENYGTIEGGNGAAAISPDGTWDAVIINSGIIRAGAGATTAIQFGTNATSDSRLELRAGSQITGNIIASALATTDALVFGGANNSSFNVSAIGPAAQYQGFDRLEKTGASTWTLTGNGSFAGPTSILEGTLIVNGSLAGSAVTVASGARLGGSGAVGALTLASGSRITPGNSIGTLTVNGAYVQNAGAAYEVEIDPGTVTSDRIQVNGAATLASGAAITVINATGAAYAAGQRYTILTSTGLTGSYGNTDLVLTPFLNLRNSTDASNAYLTVIQTNTAGGIGTTPNEVEVGKSVDSLPTGNAIQTDLYNQATLDAARRALGQLSGEIHASVRTALVDESWLLRAAVNDRLRSAFGAVGASSMATLSYGFTADLAPAVKGPMPKLPSAERFAVWGQGYGSWGRIKSDGNAASLSHSTGGLLVGADVVAFDTLRFGVVAGYTRSEFDIDRRLSSASSDNYHLGLYGGGQWGALGLRTGLSYTWHDLETRRGIVAAGLGSSLRANYDAGTAQVFGELGYRIDLGPVAFEPFAGLALVNLRSDRFYETGGAAALTGNSDDMNLGYSTLGVRASTTARVQGMDLTLRGGLGWRYAFGDVDPKLTLAFAGSTPFSVTGLPIAKNAAVVEAGLDIAISANASLGVSYAGQLAEDTQDHAFKANLAVRF